MHVAKTFVLVSTTDVYGDAGAHCSASLPSAERSTHIGDIRRHTPRLASGAAGGSEEEGLLPTLPSAMVAAALELRLRVRPSFSAPRAHARCGTTAYAHTWTRVAVSSQITF